MENSEDGQKREEQEEEEAPIRKIVTTATATNNNNKYLAVVFLFFDFHFHQVFACDYAHDTVTLVRWEIEKQSTHTVK